MTTGEYHVREWYAIMRWLVQRVDHLAENDIIAGNPLEGAHYRALRRVLAECEADVAAETSKAVS